MNRRRLLIRGLIAGIAAIVLAVLGLSLEYSSPPVDRSAMDLGVTYSVTYAEFLNLDPIQTWRDVVADLHPSHARIPVYWNRVEKTQGEYDFRELDQLMDIAKDNDVDVTLAIGRKVPRWPECHLPTWESKVTKEELGERQLAYVGEIVERYSNHPALSRWQVENEPYFVFFGNCPKIDTDILFAEYNLVKRVDPKHPIVSTVSGEQSLWIRAAKHADIVGASMYRTTYTPVIGHITYPIQPWTYRAKDHIFTGNRTIVSELQMEPWFARSLHTYTIPEQLEIFNADTFEEHLNYAQRVGIKEVSLWGVEWWYYLDANGESSLLDAAITVFENETP